MTTEAEEYAARRQALLNISMTTPMQLKQWLEASGRRYLVFDAYQLIDALPWPHGIDLLAQVIACYRDERRTIPSGRYTELKAGDPSTRVPVMRGETLEADELDRCVRYLIRQLQELDSTWRLENPIP